MPLSANKIRTKLLRVIDVEIQERIKDKKITLEECQDSYIIQFDESFSSMSNFSFEEEEGTQPSGPHSESSENSSKIMTMPKEVLHSICRMMKKDKEKAIQLRHSKSIQQKVPQSSLKEPCKQKQHKKNFNKSRTVSLS